ncbi:TrmB family transcriptional regulator [Spelaeicoccus albus]|nr:helix-turn-helix domain-containing protein [Spelaeicoccus albus]
MWESVTQLGLDGKEARFYLTVLSHDGLTVADAAELSDVSRTNAYDITKRLVQRGLIDVTETSREQGQGRRARSTLSAADPQRLIDESIQHRKVLDDLVPQLKAMRRKSGARPRVRYLEGSVGIRTALFETLSWQSPLKGILSMRDLLTEPGQEAMTEYIEGRKENNLTLQVVRSPGKDYSHGWPTSTEELRETRYAPPKYVFSMSMFIGYNTVAVVSPPDENFAMMIDSAEYAQMQLNLWEILWASSSTASPEAN